MKIGFELQLDEIPIYIKMAEILNSEYGIRLSGVSLGKRFQEEIKRAPLKNYNLSSFLKNSFKKDIPDREIDNYVHEYGELGLNRMFYIDRLLSKRKYPELLRWIIGHLKFYEYYFASEQPDYYVSSGMAYLTQLAAYLVGKKRDIPYLGIMSTRIPNERFFICRNFDDIWDVVDEIYQEANNTNRPASEFAKTFIKQFRNQPIKPLYISTVLQALSIKNSHIKEFFNRARAFYLRGWGIGRNRFDYYTYSPFYYTQRELLKMFRACLQKYTKVFQEYQEGKRFILFPLQVEQEASLLVQARFFTDQISVIENIAKCIPLGCLLYVKEHFAAFGRRNNEFYKRIAQFSNVRLIHPEENTINLIRKAELIVTISSTLGWEALLLNKPVIVLGNVFYNSSGSVTRVNNYEELESCIYKALSGKNNTIITEEYEEKLGRFVDAIFAGSYAGIFDLPLYSPQVLEDENIRLLVKGLMQDIERLKATH